MSVFIERIKIKNLLSFDEEGIDFELKPLNVLIGANASGKSNFVNSLKLLFTLNNRRELVEALGGTEELSWKGRPPAPCFLGAKLSNKESGLAVVYEREFSGEWFFAEELFTLDAQKQGISREKVQLYLGHAIQSGSGQNPLHLNIVGDTIQYILDGKLSNHSIKNFDPSQSNIFDTYGPKRTLSLWGYFNHCSRQSFIDQINIRELREPGYIRNSKDTSRQIDINELLAGIYKLGSRFEHILKVIKELYPNVLEIGFYPDANKVHIMLREKGMSRGILQTRISDGLLRTMAYLAILNQEHLPPLLCIEEPEVGLHPEVIPVLAKALKEASERTQIIVTTHSAELLNCLDTEDIVTCERGETGGTQLHRLERSKFKHWLQDYSLGDLWLKGVLGGSRY